MSNPATPIFLHSSFRMSSTWLWNKFRKSRRTRAYYEIFNEALEYMDAPDVQRADYKAWNSKHPASAPYYLEYLPLIRSGGGVEFFKASMPFGDFIPAGGVDGDLSADEVRYIESLMGAARRENLIPVLTCTRSLGRAKAIRKAFGGHTAIVYRNLFHQWASYTHLFLSGHPSFLETVDQTLATSQHDPVLKGIHEWFSDRKCSPDNLPMFYAFLFVQLYIHAQAFEASDLMIDATSLVGDVAQQREIGRRLSDWVGDEIDLSDVRSEFEVSILDVGNRDAFLDTVEQVTRLIISFCRTPESVAFVDDLKTKALKEWERHEFFARRGRLNMNLALDKLKAEDVALAQGLVAQTSAREALAQQLADETAARLALAHHVAEQEAAREALGLHVAEQAAVREALAQRVAEHALARESLAQQLADETAARTALAHHVAEQTAAREALGLHVAEQAAVREALAQRVAEHALARESLAQRVAEQAAAGESLAQKLAVEAAARAALQHAFESEAAKLRQRVADTRRHSEETRADAQQASAVASRQLQELERQLAQEVTSRHDGERMRHDYTILSRRFEDLERLVAHTDQRQRSDEQRYELAEARLRKAEKRITKQSWNTAVLWPIGAPIGALLRWIDRRLFRLRRRAKRTPAPQPMIAPVFDRPIVVAHPAPEYVEPAREAAVAPIPTKERGRLVASDSRLWFDLERSRVDGFGLPAPLRILIIKVDHIGDLILALPAIEQLRKAWPRAHLSLVCAPNNVSLAKATQLFDEIIGFSFFSEYSEDKSATPAPKYDGIGDAVTGSYDLAVDFRHDADSRPLLNRIDARFRAGFATDPEHPCALDLALPSVEKVGENNMHNIERLLLLASAVVNRFTVPELSALQALGNVGRQAPPFDGQDYLVLAPGAGTALKKWPLEYFTSLASAIVTEHALKLVIIGGEREKDVAAAIVEAVGENDVLDLVGKSSLTDLPRILRSARAFIGNDTGVTHIAALQGVNTICLFSGAPDSTVWRAVGPATRVLRSEQPCSPCRKLELYECINGHACMREITVETVLQQLSLLLDDGALTRVAAVA